MPGHLSGATRLFPIIGDPIKYVESPMRLTRTFEERDYNGICVPMQVPADDLDAVMAGLTASRNVDGILVTMPHKFTAFAHCATSSERAKMLGVVSVMRRNPDGTCGDMLDGLALCKRRKTTAPSRKGAGPPCRRWWRGQRDRRRPAGGRGPRTDHPRRRRIAGRRSWSCSQTSVKDG
jgi:shikimate dehydrogenase